MKKIKTLLIGATALLCLFSCHSPESEGKKIAIECNDCKTKVRNQLGDDYKELLAELKAKKFTSQYLANKKLDSIQHHEDSVKRGCDSVYIANFTITRRKYATDEVNLAKFIDAAVAQNATWVDPVDKMIPNLIHDEILAIVDIKPDYLRLKSELMGESIGRYLYCDMTGFDQKGVISVKPTSYGLDYTLKVKIKDIEHQTETERIIIVTYWRASKAWAYRYINTPESLAMKGGTEIPI